MYGINVGFEIGKRALLAQQYSLNLTGHNISNVNTPGFTRQQSVMTSTQPFSAANGIFGTGVEVVSVRQLRSIFLDKQYRQESQNLGRWRSLSQGWGQIETVYMEPSDTGFGAVLDKFWSSWQDLAANPDEQAARVEVREQAGRLINSLQHYSKQLREFRTAIDDDIHKRIEDINNIGRQLASLNEAIMTTELTGHRANDLRDRRNYLVDELSNYVNVQVIEQPSGSYTVMIGSMALVDRTEVSELEAAVVGEGHDVIHELRFKDSQVKPEITRGELSGLMELRDDIIAERLAELDEIAVSLAQSVNEIHRRGYGIDGVSGRDFFDPSTTGADDIKLADNIIEDTATIAASGNGAIGDNANALAIAALRSQSTMRGGTTSIGDFYNSVVGIVGVRSREAQNMLENQESLVAHIEENRQALMGVSLDEEMTNMIRYQHAYEAAARVITTMDAALDTVINNMGIVGR